MTARRASHAASASTEPPQLPDAPGSIAKGSSLKDLLDTPAINALADHIRRVHPPFDVAGFVAHANDGLAPLGIMQRGAHLARALRPYLPANYEKAVEVLVRSLVPPHTRTDELGLAVFFYLPHTHFVALYGRDPAHNDGRDPFEASMRAQHELTRRFTAEFSIRPFLVDHTERTLARLMEWTRDPDPHVRRLCSEGTRPRLPWGLRLGVFVKDPRPCLPILEALKDDPELYVRRSVANHLGDIAKDHPELVFELCASWLSHASTERRWLIRHALRHPAKKGNPTALRLRQRAK